MSTVLPATHIEIGKAVEAAGGRFIECPVGGSVKVASEGKLLGFAGGDAADSTGRARCSKRSAAASTMPGRSAPAPR